MCQLGKADPTETPMMVMVMVGQSLMVGKLSLKVILVDGQGRYLLTFENRESCDRQGVNIQEVASILSA